MVKHFGKYNDYFDIDSEYFPQVNRQIIEENPDLWLKYYPHESFVKLIEATVRVLNRSEKKALWVEGAYGTGKSHAVLTLKKLIDADDAAVQKYFGQNDDLLSADLYQKFVSMRRQGGQILTVHRYGSSDIRSDDDLNMAVYQSLVEAMAERQDLRNPQASFKVGVLEWLKTARNRRYLDDLLVEYRDKVKLNGANVDEVERLLTTSRGEALESVLRELMLIGRDANIGIFKLDKEQLLGWIGDIIRENNLRILFVWDEFSEFFKNNMRSMTGFQRFADFAGEQPFYMLIVTHHTANLFSSDRDARKIFDRFVRVPIELPPHMGFKLIGKALQRNTAYAADWEELQSDQRSNTKLSRAAVMKYAKVDDDDLRSILPIHPYTAVVLKEISAAFASNQRSMFDFIKNDSDPNTKGFKWFIQNFGPTDDTPLFMIDMLWSFFYERNRMSLEGNIRNILDYYTKVRVTDEYEQRVLKTVLILQAIADQTNASTKDMRGANAIFIPTLDNIRMAFENDESLGPDKAQSTLEALVRKQIIYKKTENRVDVYNAMMMAMNNDEFDKMKREQMEKFQTEHILPEEREFALQSNGLHRRFKMSYLSERLFRTRFTELNTQSANDIPDIPLVIALSKNDDEYEVYYRKIEEAYSQGKDLKAVVAVSGESFGAERLNDYIENLVNRDIQRGKDNKLSEQYENRKNECKTRWYGEIKNHKFIVFSSEHPHGVNAQTYLELQQTVLKEIVRKRYPFALELSFNVNDVLWNDNQLRMGAECAIKREILKGQYKSSKPETDIKAQLDNIWTDPSYWKHAQTNDPCNTLADMKQTVDKFIQKQFEENGRVSFREIYQRLQKSPYGLLKCNMSAFVMGFVLREYATDDYAWSDGMIPADLDVSKLAVSIDTCIKGVGKNRDEYITKNDEEKRKFAEATAHIFGIAPQECRQVEDARKNLRVAMNKLSFPIWTLKYNLKSDCSENEKAELIKYIDSFSKFVNNDNTDTTDKELTGEIARIYKRDQTSAHSLRDLVKKDAVKKSMAAYVAEKCPELVNLADRLGDTDKKYLDRIKSKFSHEGNWLWSADTVNEQIQKTLAEYRLIEASLNFIEQTVSYDEALRRWTEKLNSVKISYRALCDRNLDHPKALLEALNRLIEDKQIDPESFVDLIEAEGGKLEDFFTPVRQQLLFAEVNQLEKADLSEAEIQKIYTEYPGSQWTKPADIYLNEVSNRVTTYKNNTLAGKLAELWNNKTHSASPRDWSKMYNMPIQDMVDESDQEEAVRCFETINSRSTAPADVREATEFVNRIDWSCLTDAAYRDDVFRRIYLSKYADLLTNIEEVQQTLLRQIGEPYKWFHNTQVERKLEELAREKYLCGGNQLAMDKIDHLDADSLRAYLKDLIKNNYIVGIEIIRSK